VNCLSGWECTAVGSTNPASSEPATYVLAGSIARPGYRFVASDGGIFSFGAPFFGSMGGQPLNKPIVAMAVMPDGGGYFEVASDGGLFVFGNAVFAGSMGGQPLNSPIVGMAVVPNGTGYCEVASDGGLFAFGDAVFAGSMGGKPLNDPIVGIGVTLQGGYYEVASDAGLFAFGGAQFFGSQGGQPLNRPIVGIAPLPGELLRGGLRRRHLRLRHRPVPGFHGRDAPQPADCGHDGLTGARTRAPRAPRAPLFAPALRDGGGCAVMTAPARPRHA